MKKIIPVIILLFFVYHIFDVDNDIREHRLRQEKNKLDTYRQGAEYKDKNDNNDKNDNKYKNDNYVSLRGGGRVGGVGGRSIGRSGGRIGGGTSRGSRSSVGKSSGSKTSSSSSKSTINIESPPKSTGRQKYFYDTPRAYRPMRWDDIDEDIKISKSAQPLQSQYPRWYYYFNRPSYMRNATTDKEKNR